MLFDGTLVALRLHMLTIAIVLTVFAVLAVGFAVLAWVPANMTLGAERSWGPIAITVDAPITINLRPAHAR